MPIALLMHPSQNEKNDTTIMETKMLSFFTNVPLPARPLSSGKD
jgi:hypothetical protein